MAEAQNHPVRQSRASQRRSGLPPHCVVQAKNTLRSIASIASRNTPIAPRRTVLRTHIRAQNPEPAIRAMRPRLAE